jgi:hypothetical protein
MILQPLRTPALVSAETISAWNAVATTQEQDAPGWWLIAQPDHAALAGDLAAHFGTPEFPCLDSDVVCAIALHDAGWAKYDGGSEAGGGSVAVPQPLRDGSGRPLSFLSAPVSLFVEAWTASIEYAEEKAGATGGLLVSGHFRRLAEHRLASVDDSSADTARLRAFVEDESRQDETRFQQQSRDRSAIERLVDLLQFCDLLSLYLCCGSRANVQFPQQIGSRNIVLRRHGELCLLNPSPFCEEISLGVPARRDPLSGNEPNACVLPVLVR